jgi:hypothetical protein
LLRIGLAADACVSRVIIREQYGMAQGVNSRLTEHEPVIGWQLMRQPQSLTAARSEAGEADIFEFITAQAFGRKTGETRGQELSSRNTVQDVVR